MIHEALSPDCLRFRNSLVNQLDEVSLSLEETEFLDAHPRSCPTCKAYSHEMAHILETLQNMETLPVPEDLNERIFAKIKQPTPLRRPIYLAIAASVLALVISTSVLSSWQQPSKPASTARALLAAQPAHPHQSTDRPLASKTDVSQAALKPTVKASPKKKRQTSAPAASRKILIAMGSPEEHEASDLLAHWVPLEEEQANLPEANPALMGEPTGEAEDVSDPLQTLVGF